MSNDLAYDFEEQLIDDLHLAQRTTEVKAVVPHPPRRRRLTRLTGAGLVVSGGVAAAVVLLGTGSTSFAGWTPVARAATTAQVSSATQGCEPMLVVPGQATEPNWHVVASEDQGPYTLLVYAGGDTMATCLSAPGTKLRLVSFGAAAFRAGSAEVAIGPGAQGEIGRDLAGIQATSIDGELAAVVHGTSDEGSYTIVEGPVAAAVYGLSLVRANGATVVTSVKNGWFAAWWPGSDDPTSANITTAAGTTSTPVSALSLVQATSGAGASGAAAGSTGIAIGGTSPSTSTTGRTGPTAGPR